MITNNDRPYWYERKYQTLEYYFLDGLIICKECGYIFILFKTKSSLLIEYNSKLFSCHIIMVVDVWIYYRGI